LVENLDKGFIDSSKAPFAAPVLFVKKANGSLRFCIDYRKLNNLTRKDRYPLPLIDETLARLAKAKIYTKLDIRQAFHRIRIDPASEELTTFRTRYGAYKCKVLPFGLTNGPATYQRYMNDVLFDYLDDFCTAYLDDILIYSEDPLEHETHVKKVLDRLRTAGLQADIKKSEFHVTSTKYLGFIVTTNGIRVDPEKVEVVSNWKEPRTVKGIQSFLGFCNFYRRFITNYGRITKPLNNLTRKGTPFRWDSACQEAFDQLKISILSAPVLQHYHADRQTIVETDASDGVVGGVLSQQDPSTKLWHPIAYFSKTMQAAELNYDIHDKELLAVVLAIKEWRAWLEGLQTKEPFLLYSDHRALEYFMTTKKLTARQARWAELLTQYHFKLQYRTGKANERADALSRKTEDIEQQQRAKDQYRTQVLLPADKIAQYVGEDLKILRLAPIEISPIKKTQYDSLQLLSRILEDNKTNPDLKELRAKATTEQEDTWTLRDGLLLRYGKLYITEGAIQDVPLRTAVIREAHDQPLTGHPGRAKLRQLIQSRYYWPGQGKDIDRYCANCYTCRRAHVPRDKKPGLLQQLAVPDRPWQHITVDFKKCPESKSNYNMVAIFVDRLSKRPITVPVRDTITARELVPIFLTHVARHVGLPDSITSDRGPQFVSDFWNEACKRLQIKIKLSTANHPQTDGQTEIVNQYFDQRLRPYINYYQDDWDKWVAIFDYQQACLWHETTGQSPFLTEKGYEPRTSFDWESPVSASTPKERLNRTEAKALIERLHKSWEQAKTGMQQSQQRYAKQANKHRREVDFGVGDKVWVSTKHWKTDRPSRKLADQMSGPYEIIKQIGHSFKLQLPDSIKVHPVFHADRLRKAPEDPLPGQKNADLPPVQVNDQEEYEVEQVLAVKLLRNKLRYRIKWKGWDDDPKWYPASTLRNAPIALRTFYQDNPRKKGPPKNLEYWLDCAARDTFADEQADDDQAKPESAPNQVRDKPESKNKTRNKTTKARGRAF
jgi:transposase InsO family protein